MDLPGVRAGRRPAELTAFFFEVLTQTLLPPMSMLALLVGSSQ